MFFIFLFFYLYFYFYFPRSIKCWKQTWTNMWSNPMVCELPNPHWTRSGTTDRALSFSEIGAQQWEVFRLGWWWLSLKLKRSFFRLVRFTFMLYCVLAKAMGKWSSVCVSNSVCILIKYSRTFAHLDQLVYRHGTF